MTKKQKETLENAPTVGMVSLGCAKNLVESEVMLADLALKGFIITGDYADADVLIVNTCGFLQVAQEEAAEAIDQLAALKAPNGRCRCLVVAGCWSQIAADQILNRWPQVDLVIGVNDRQRLIDSIGCVSEADEPVVKVSPKVQPMPIEDTRFRLTPTHWAYLRISEGCSQGCTFCTIPRIRGRYRSKQPDLVVREARQLVASGARELVLIGQETTNYGHDMDLKGGLAALLGRLDRVPSLDWIRLMYTYPANFDDAAIAAMADLEHVVEYVDIPLQHISDRILKRMGRRIDRSATERLLDKLRSRMPDIAIRTTLIVGFPGETDDDFQQLLDFVRTWQFDAMGAFAFSPEPGTPAAAMPDQTEHQVKLQRLDALMRVQRSIARRKAKNWIGRRFDAYVEPPDPSARGDFWPTRHRGQAPEVDPVTLVRRADLAAVSAGPGDKLRLECTATRGYDLVARPVR